MKTKFSGKLTLLLIAMICIVFSCSDPALDERSEKVVGETEITAKDLSQPMLGTAYALNKVDLLMSGTPLATGTVTVEIRNSDGTVTLGSSTRPASLVTGNVKTFSFSTPLILTAGEHYKIYVTRSAAPNGQILNNNSLYWRISASGIDAYPVGVSSVSPTRDFGFITYDADVADQQPSTSTGIAIPSNGNYLWQEFVAGLLTTNLKSVDLRFDVSAAATGTVTVQIRDASGVTVHAQKIMTREELPNGLNWIKFPLVATLIRNQIYRIYVTRSDQHNSSGNNSNRISWSSSVKAPITQPDVDSYLDGASSVYPLDFAFRTYGASGVDQQQNDVSYAYGIMNTFFDWQEFVPRNP